MFSSRIPFWKFRGAPGPSVDPFCANVVLLLHGNGVNGGTTFVDSSQSSKTPVELLNVTTSNEQTLFGQNTIKSVSGVNSNQSRLDYGSSIDFTTSTIFTLEFWMYPIDAGQPYFMGKSSAIYMGIDWVGNELQAVNWPAIAGPSLPITPNAWNYVVIQQSGTVGNTVSGYINGSRQFFDAATMWGGSPAAEQLSITRVPGRNDLLSFEGYLAEIRYTQGVSRYTGSTIPIQSAPWPSCAL